MSRWPPSWMPPSATLASCRWRLSCCGSVPAERSVASLWRRGGRDDERNDLRARLRILDRIRVSRTRVLRVMRTQGLLSPHRGRQGEMKVHEGTIATSAPSLMWGTDGVRVFTAEDGWVWTFAAVDNWNAECVGWHVCQVGSRFAALEPIAQGLGRGGRGPRAGATDGSRQPVAVGPLSQPAPLLGHPPQLRLR